MHHSAITLLKNPNKRGRPDITHLCLLNALGSPLNKSGHLKLFLHTNNNKIFEFNPEIRIARNYNRFKGLMAKLLIDDFIGTKDSKLIIPYDGNLQELINSFEDHEITLFSCKGKLIDNYRNLFPKAPSRNCVTIIGGFQKSGFSEKISRLSDNLISISSYSLDAWIVVSKVISFYESVNEII